MPQRNSPFVPSAFTLVELMVVIALITLLISLVLPAVKAARANARSVEGLANLSQIGRGLASYAVEYAGTLPTGWRQDAYPDVGPHDTNWAWLLDHHWSGSGPTRATRSPGALSKVFRAPNARSAGGTVHYMGHPVLLVDITRTSLPHYRIERLVRATEVLMVMDGCQVPPYDNSSATAVEIDNLGLWDASWNPVFYQRADPDNGTPIDPGPDVDGPAGSGQIRWRQHRGAGANFLFADGHATTHGPAEITKASIRPDR